MKAEFLFQKFSFRFFGYRPRGTRIYPHHPFSAQRLAGYVPDPVHVWPRIDLAVTADALAAGGRLPVPSRATSNPEPSLSQSEPICHGVGHGVGHVRQWRRNKDSM
jgi:hypothetical protein